MTPRQREMLEAVERAWVTGHRGFRGGARLVFASLLKKGWVECGEDSRWRLTASGFQALYPNTIATGKEQKAKPLRSRRT